MLVGSVSSPPIVAAYKLQACSIGDGLAAGRDGAAADAAQRFPEIGQLPTVFDQIEAKKLQAISGHRRQPGNSRMHPGLRHAGTTPTSSRRRQSWPRRGGKSGSLGMHPRWSKAGAAEMCLFSITEQWQARLVVHASQMQFCDWTDRYQRQSWWEKSGPGCAIQGLVCAPCKGNSIICAGRFGGIYLQGNM